jgi:hypothetical protein
LTHATCAGLPRGRRQRLKVAVNVAVTLIVKRRMKLWTPTWNRASLIVTARLTMKVAVNVAMRVPPI